MLKIAGLRFAHPPYGRSELPAAIRPVEYHGEDVQSGGMAAILRTMTVTVTDLDKNAQSISVVGLNDWR